MRLSNQLELVCKLKLKFIYSTNQRLNELSECLTECDEEQCNFSCKSVKLPLRDMLQLLQCFILSSHSYLVPTKYFMAPLVVVELREKANKSLACINTYAYKCIL